MGRGRVPNFWWDFNEPGEFPIKVESDVDYLPDPITRFHGGRCDRQSRRPD